MALSAREPFVDLMSRNAPPACGGDPWPALIPIIRREYRIKQLTVKNDLQGLGVPAAMERASSWLVPRRSPRASAPPMSFSQNLGSPARPDPDAFPLMGGSSSTVSTPAFDKFMGTN
jgi:hypothetical protein